MENILRYYNSTAKRAALLISAPGGNNNSEFLAGVSKDLIHMRRFLKSSKAGSWLDEEIMELSNPTANELRLMLNRLSVDYLVVYFSGHGSTSQNQRMIALRDGTIADTELFNHSPRQLVIIDACRTHGGAGLSGFEIADPEINCFEGGTYELFNAHILDSPAGRLIVHATQSGLSTYDNSLTGGLFTSALLRVASRMQSLNDYSPCLIEDVLQHVPAAVKKENGFMQIPTVVYRSGNLTVPFSLSLTKREYELLLQKHRDRKLVEDFIGIAAVTVLVICIIGAASAK